MNCRIGGPRIRLNIAWADALHHGMPSRVVAFSLCENRIVGASYMPGSRDKNDVMACSRRYDLTKLRMPCRIVGKREAGKVNAASGNVGPSESVLSGLNVKNSRVAPCVRPEATGVRKMRHRGTGAPPSTDIVQRPSIAAYPYCLFWAA